MMPPSLASFSLAHSSRLASAAQVQLVRRGDRSKRVRRSGPSGNRPRAGVAEHEQGQGPASTRLRGEGFLERSRQLRLVLTSPFQVLLGRLSQVRRGRGPREACELAGQSTDPTPPSGAGPSGEAGVLWFRNDLRVHDNEALSEAMKRCSSILPVFCFDTREYGGSGGSSAQKNKGRFDRAGPYKAAFTQEAVRALRKKLKSLGSDLVVRVGKPEDIIPELCDEVKATLVFCQGEVSKRDQEIEEAVEKAIKSSNKSVTGGKERRLERCWGSSTLHHIDDVPFELKSMPTNYSAFCKQLQSAEIKPPARTPKKLKEWPALARGKIPRGNIPTLQELGLDSPASKALHIKTKDGCRARGGEDRALSYLKHHSKKVKGGLLPRGMNRGKLQRQGVQSLPDQLAPWFSLGCVSVKRACEEVLGGARESTSSIAEVKRGEEKEFLFELLWRDFFRFSRMKMAQAST
ncbi:DNA photolyase [Chloropicon primus]|nr:DNA photolyase [Chloropicon primus]